QRLKRECQNVVEEPAKRQKTREASGSVQEQTCEEPKAEELSQEQLHHMIMIYSEDTRKYWKIIRVGGHTEAYQTFDDMLKKFDRDDMDKLCNLVKERFRTIEPTEDKARELWVELKRLFEPDDNDTLWKLQRYMHDPLKWYVVPTSRVVVPTGRYVVPAGKVIIIVSPGRLSLVPTGRVLSPGRVKQRLMLIED
ncbi:hypothetical protein Tco_1558331, partial [Tanacetum coccineum]